MLRYVVAEVVLDTNLIFMYATPFSTAPPLSHYLSNKMRDPCPAMFLKNEQIRARVKVLESIAGAMEREDGTDSRHIPLSHVFREHIASCRKEVKAMGEELKTIRIYSFAGNDMNYPEVASRSKELDHSYLLLINKPISFEFI